MTKNEKNLIGIISKIGYNSGPICAIELKISVLQRSRTHPLICNIFSGPFYWIMTLNDFLDNDDENLHETTFFSDIT